MTASASRIWVVDDDRSVRFVLATALSEAGYDVASFDGAAAVHDALAARRAPDLLFTDVRMPGDSGLQLLDALKRDHPQLPVVVMSAYTDVASTAGAFRGGAHEFLSKPFDLDEAVALAERVLGDRDSDAGGEVAPAPDATTDALVGDTPVMRDLFRAIGRLAQAPVSVLVTGETGTGKELVARALHRESPRAARPFVALNTAAIPAELLESELFGHEAGAFTGAARRHVGRFEQAHGGTLFLDEIGEISASFQAKLLRVLQEGQVQRLGSDREHRVDVRVIAATNRDLAEQVRQKAMRADFYHRLSVYPLHVPALRERGRDVLTVAGFFLEEARARHRLGGLRLDAGAQAALLAYAWPGNVRELEHTIGRAVIRALADLPARPRILSLGAADLDLAVPPRRAGDAPAGEGVADERDTSSAGPLDLDYRQAVSAFETGLIERALQQHQGNWAAAARSLHVDRANLARMARRLGIAPRP